MCQLNHEFAISSYYLLGNLMFTHWPIDQYLQFPLTQSIVTLLHPYFRGTSFQVPVHVSSTRRLEQLLFLSQSIRTKCSLYIRIRISLKMFACFSQETDSNDALSAAPGISPSLPTEVGM